MMRRRPARPAPISRTGPSSTAMSQKWRSLGTGSMSPPFKGSRGSRMYPRSGCAEIGQIVSRRPVRSDRNGARGSGPYGTQIGKSGHDRQQAASARDGRRRDRAAPDRFLQMSDGRPWTVPRRAMTVGGRWVGAPVPRKEDEALLTGRARFIDDMEPVPGIRHAALLRSPHAHAEILSIDVSKAASHPGVYGVLTGADIAAATRPIPSAVRVPIDYYPMAAGKVRYAGEPVALIAAEDRYVAEDALELIEVEYRPLPPVIDLKAAMNDHRAFILPMSERIASFTI
ncbi:MAG: hypothetical protein F4Y62_17675, partial [Rhodospirillaceae bacterium]|nr:hypothetical protein [Rhodospirillaceae bacterium]